jgi:hypothetical protein
MAQVMGWMSRGRFRARPVLKAHLLVHPPSTLVLGLFGFGMFAGMALYISLFPDDTTTWRLPALLMCFALFFTPLVLGFVVERHEVTDDGIAARTFVGVRKRVRWSELRAVRFAPVAQWFRLESNSGTVVRVSTMLIGLPEFARLLLQGAPEEAINVEALELLRQTAEGNPPPVGG